jgi:hypothetical protein
MIYHFNILTSDSADFEGRSADLGSEEIFPGEV